jgi:hypothetical protein
VIIPLAVAAALLVGGSFAAWKFWPETTTAGPQAESSTTAAESQAPSTAISSPSPSASASATAEPASAASQKALEACQTRVRAADDVLKQGKIGVLHWVDHVKAQTDNFDGKISVEEMRAQFKKTRVKGGADLSRYNDALSTYEDLEGSCGKATAAGMKDWESHQKQMQRNKEHQAGSPSQAQAAWLKQYRAAPENIKAFKKADKNFEAPKC